MTASIPDIHPHRPIVALRTVEDRSGEVPRRIPDDAWGRFEGYAAEILGAFGMDLTDPGTAATPRRFIRALFDATDGYDGDPKLLTAFPTECRGGADCEVAQVVEGPIPFVALCEHHVLPFHGTAWVGYVAHDQIIGVSKLTRLVRVVTRRFGVQERMTHGIADRLESMLHPHGVAVYLEAQHMCTEMRGVREHEPVTRTTAWRGTYGEDPNLRREFFDVARHRRPAMTMTTMPDSQTASDERWRIEPLFEAPAPDGRVRGGSLPPDLAGRYGADLAIALRTDRPTIVSNFVSTIDGVVAFDTDGRTGGREVSGASTPDRFLMGLVRATADAVLIGAGTVRSGGHHRWSPAYIYPRRPRRTQHGDASSDSRPSRRRSSSAPAARSIPAIPDSTIRASRS